MLTEEHTSQETFHLGQAVIDDDGNTIGKVQARFNRYVQIGRAHV